MRVRILWEGKTKNPHLRALQADYASRIQRFLEVKIEELPAGAPGSAKRDKLTASERRMLEKLHGSRKIVLDERGRRWTSAEFAEWLGREAVAGTRDLAFLVGGPGGFSSSFRRQADLLLALSPMTLTRDWARTLLLEQIYRSFTILRGYPYPR